MEYKNREEGGFWTSWGLIIALFLLPLPGLSAVAVILMLMKLFRKDRREMEQIPPLQPETRYTVDTRINKPARKQPTQQSSQQKGQEWQDSRPMETVRQITKSPKPKKSTIRGLTIGGVFLAFLGLVQIEAGMGFADWMAALAFVLGGGAMILKGVLMQKDGKRYAKYLPIIADREAMSVEEVSRISGESVKQVERDLEDMAEKGFFGDGAYLNRELGYLVRSSTADQAWQEKQNKARREAPKEVNEGYADILRNIRQANDRIADPVLSEKIDRLEDVTRRIFHAVEEDPKKADKIDTFLNYYLPTTQKLLDSYAQFEAAGVEGGNLSQAKARISDTMDMILKGFSRQLDQLYQADTMDVDADIRVMESMLRRDTRTVADDFYGSRSAASGGASRAGGTFGGTFGGTVQNGGGGTSAPQPGRFGQSFEEDFGGAAVQRMPEDQ